MKKLLLRIQHLFMGHGLLLDYDRDFLYCDCGKKIEHYNGEIIYRKNEEKRRSS